MRSKDVSEWFRTCSMDSNYVVANVDINWQKTFISVEQICLFLKEQSFFFLQPGLIVIVKDFRNTEVIRLCLTAQELQMESS